MANEWVEYRKDLRDNQPLPHVKRYVLLQGRHRDPSYADPVFVGYLKLGAGERDSPYFVHPGMTDITGVYRWCDCLPDDFTYPIAPPREQRWGK